MPSNKCRRRKRAWDLAALQQAQDLLHQAPAFGGPARGRGRGRGRGGVRGGRGGSGRGGANGGRGRGGANGGRGRGGQAPVQAAEQAPEPVASARNDLAAAVEGPARGRRRRGVHGGRRRRFVYGGPRRAGGGVYVCRGRGGQPSEQAAEVPAAENQDDLNPDDYEPRNPKPEFGDPVKMFQAIKKAEKLLASMLKDMKLPVQESIDDVHCFYVDWRLKRDSLDLFYEESSSWFKENFKFCIPVFLDDGSVAFVRLTPDKEATIEQRTHHIVVLVRQSDNAHAEILVENFSLYAVAMRMVYDGDDRKDVVWSVVGEEDLNSKLYKFKRIKSRPAYSDIGSVYLGKRTGRNLFSFIESLGGLTTEIPEDDSGDDEEFDDEGYGDGSGDDGDVDGEETAEEADEEAAEETAEEADEEAAEEADEEAADRESSREKKENPVNGGFELTPNRCLDTIYTVFCEGRRFWRIREWAVGKRGRFPSWGKDAVQDWSCLGKCVQQLFLYLSEEFLAFKEGENSLMAELAEESKTEALTWWRDRQKALAGKMNFYSEMFTEDGQLLAPMLRQIACTELTLIKTEKETRDRICMRMLKYNGPWANKIMERSDSAKTKEQVVPKRRPVPADLLLLIENPSLLLFGIEAEIRDWWNWFENEWCWKEENSKFWSSDEMYLRCMMDWWFMFQ